MEATATVHRAAALHEAAARAGQRCRAARVSGGGEVLQLGVAKAATWTLLGVPLAALLWVARPLGSSKILAPILDEFRLV